MKFIVPMLLVAGISQAAQSEIRTKIAVIDTGISDSQTLQPYMCKDGVRNMTRYGKSDNHGHGSHIVHIIGSRIDTKKFCIVSYKVYHVNRTKDTLVTSIKALRDIAKSNFKYVNVSMSGDSLSMTEFKYYKKLTQRGVKVSVAAGNNSKDLDKKCDIYPACYKLKLNKNFYTVSAKDLEASNKGSFTIKEKGKNIKSYGGFMSGSSQATALWTSKLINRSR